MKFLLLGGVIVVGVALFLIRRSVSNVCKTFEDYYSNRDNNKNCYYNPDDELSVPEVIKRWGYPVQTHRTITQDGYILTMFRIPRKSNSAASQPVFIQHGYKSNSKCFVSTGKKSLAFILANEGYDVWLGNFRGTAYSKSHVHFSNNSEPFWDFSFHEMGIYDVAAQIDYIANVTNQKLIFIGYSLGTTAATIYHSTYPEIAEDRVKIFIKLAPFIYTNGMSSFTTVGLKLWPYVAPIGQALTNGQYYTEGIKYANSLLWKYICYPYPIQMKICQIFDMWSFGFNYDQNDPETLPITLLQLTETSSIKTVTHLSQLMKSEKFQQYDYGTYINMQKYGKPEPPEYGLSDMRVPIYLIRAENDWVSTKEAVENFNATLPAHIKPHGIYVVGNRKFNHINFVFGKDVVSLLYDHLLKFIGQI